MLGKKRLLQRMYFQCQVLEYLHLDDYTLYTGIRVGGIGSEGDTGITVVKCGSEGETGIAVGEAVVKKTQVLKWGDVVVKETHILGEAVVKGKQVVQ
jgi:hypothetical protein